MFGWFKKRKTAEQIDNEVRNLAVTVYAEIFKSGKWNECKAEAEKSKENNAFSTMVFSGIYTCVQKAQYFIETGKDMPADRFVMLNQAGFDDLIGNSLDSFKVVDSDNIDCVATQSAAIFLQTEMLLKVKGLNLYRM